MAGSIKTTPSPLKSIVLEIAKTKAEWVVKREKEEANAEDIIDAMKTLRGRAKSIDPFDQSIKCRRIRQDASVEEGTQMTSHGYCHLRAMEGNKSLTPFPTLSRCCCWWCSAMDSSASRWLIDKSNRIEPSPPWYARRRTREVLINWGII